MRSWSKWSLTHSMTCLLSLLKLSPLSLLLIAGTAAGGDLLAPTRRGPGGRSVPRPTVHVVRRQSRARVRHARRYRRARGGGGRGHVQRHRRRRAVRRGSPRRRPPATYGGLASSSLRTGDAVAARSVVGETIAHLHFGLRDGDVYIDPAPFLGRLVGRPRLVPSTARRPRWPTAPLAVRVTTGPGRG